MSIKAYNCFAICMKLHRQTSRVITSDISKCWSRNQIIIYERHKQSILRMNWWYSTGVVDGFPLLPSYKLTLIMDLSQSGWPHCEVFLFFFIFLRITALYLPCFNASVKVEMWNSTYSCCKKVLVKLMPYFFVYVFSEIS